MTRRPRRVVPASLVALVILAICVITAVSVIQELAGRPPLVPLGTLARHARALRLDATAMVTAGAVATVAGLILLSCALIPGRPGTLALAAIPAGTGDGPCPAAVVSRPGLQAALCAAARDVDGVTAARVRFRRQLVIARVRTELNSTTALCIAVQATLENRLAQAGLAGQPEVRVRVRHVARGAA